MEKLSIWVRPHGTDLAARPASQDGEEGVCEFPEKVEVGVIWGGNGEVGDRTVCASFYLKK